MKATKTFITFQASMNVSIKKAREYRTNPPDTMKWNNASEDLHTTRAENDLRAGGRFLLRFDYVKTKNVLNIRSLRLR